MTTPRPNLHGEILHDGIKVGCGYDIALVHTFPSAESITGMLGNGHDEVGHFKIDRDTVISMARALGIREIPA